MLISIPEAGAILGIGRSKTYQLIEQGDLATVNIGRRRLVVVESVRSLVGTLRS
jgi:excisionase family DNA binding protein